MKASVYVGISLDGFIARLNGDIEWLDSCAFDGPDEDYGYQKFMDSVDVLVMGRKSFEKVLTFGDWPYGSKPVVVLSKTGVAIPEGIAGTVECMTCSPAEVIQRLAERGAKQLYIDGGQTVQSFLRAGLITDMTISRLPILIGAGIPLFGPLPADVRLRHVETRAYPSGLVQSRYEVIASTSDASGSHQSF